MNNILQKNKIYIEDHILRMLFKSCGNICFAEKLIDLNVMSTVDNKNNPVLRAFLDIKLALAASVAKVIVKPEDVEDILQETYMLVCSQSYKTEIRSIKGYFFRVARNVALRDVTKRTRAKFRSLEELAHFEPSSDEVGADDKLHYSMELETFFEVTQSLPTKCRQAFLLKKMMGLSQKEISRKMGIAESTVEKHLITAMRRTVNKMRTQGYQVGTTRELAKAGAHGKPGAHGKQRNEK